MDILVPFLDLRPELVSALVEQDLEAIYVETKGHDSYWRTLSVWWEIGRTFIVLEQDKIPAPGLLQELWDCSQPWCTTPVSMRGVEQTSPYPSLSCTKFDSRLMARWPSLLEEVGLLNLGFGKKEWSRLDLGIAALLEIDWEVHWHAGGRVEHLHDPLAE